MTFETFALSPVLLRGVADHGYTTPTPLQRDALPLAPAGRDLIASAQTGTGKTAAFMLPALERLQVQKPVKRSAPRVLVLTPTRELALQIIAEGKIYGRHARVAQGAIIGGVGYGPQLQLLGQRIDLLVATPGRMIDHLERQSVRLEEVELLVLDEADRMLDMGFIHAVKRIVGKCPKARQTLMFTATWDDRLAKLAKEMLVDPVRVSVAAPVRETPAITQAVHLADDNDHKHKLLRHVLAGVDGQSLVFAGTKRKVKRLAERLEREGLKAGQLHGDMAQNARNRTLDALRSKQIDVLVATDVAGRGIDVPDLALVVNVDLPHVPEDYVHRIGRTGRAGATGRAVSIVSIDDRPLLAAIEKFTKTEIERVTASGLEPTVVDHPAMRQAQGRQPNRQPQQKRQQQKRQQQGRSHGPANHQGRSHAPAQKPRQPTPAHRPERVPAPMTALDEHRPAFLMRKTAAR
ncbi:MAG: DEAD/DEAH box helicase [Alphaproteobacteria bacterium]|nr:DEAD/DEAH box helicase [Alphaproteobacteria bacterium]